MKKHVFIVGAFPPPVHGMAQVNFNVRSTLLESGVNVTTFDLSGRTLSRGVGARLRRLYVVARTLIGFARNASKSPTSTLYVGLSGGWGQAYEICFVAIGKAFGFSVFLHHHSFAYLHKSKVLTRILVWVAGNAARHIVLCERMATLLRLNYGQGMIVRVVSNAAITAPSNAENAWPRNFLHSVGYLSNISRQKGVFLFISIMDELHKRGAEVVGRIAGPFQDDKVASEVLDLISSSSRLQYVGPRYGQDKVQFLDSIDVLVFPSRYVNEAEPLTLHEAMARALPVLSLSRGCISEIVPAEAGAVLDDDESFVSRAADILMEWWLDPTQLRGKSEGAIAAYSHLRQSHLGNFSALCTEIATS